MTKMRTMKAEQLPLVLADSPKGGLGATPPNLLGGEASGMPIARGKELESPIPAEADASRLMERITFQQLNLLEGTPPQQPFEIIFCRNVMIYFDRQTQETLATRLARFLVPGGYFFTGRAESLNGMALPLRCLSPSIYQKTGS